MIFGVVSKLCTPAHVIAKFSENFYAAYLRFSTRRDQKYAIKYIHMNTKFVQIKHQITAFHISHNNNKIPMKQRIWFRCSTNMCNNLFIWCKYAVFMFCLLSLSASWLFAHIDWNKRPAFDWNWYVFVRSVPFIFINRKENPNMSIQ